MRCAAARALCLGLLVLPCGCLRTSQLREATELSEGERSEQLVALARATRSWWHSLKSEAERVHHKDKSAGARTIEGVSHGGAPQCSAEDSDSAKEYFKDVEQHMVDWVNNLTKSFEVGSLESDLQELVTNGTLQKTMNALPLGTKILGNTWKTAQDLIKWFPKSCTNPLAMADKGWPQFIACAHQAAGVSKPCIRCVPRFVHQITHECKDSCFASMDSMYRGMLPAMQPVFSDLMVSGVVNLGKTDMADKLQGKLGEIGTRLSGLMKAYLPCLKCMKKHSDVFAGCINADSNTTGKINELFGIMIDGLQTNVIGQLAMGNMSALKLPSLHIA